MSLLHLHTSPGVEKVVEAVNRLRDTRTKLASVQVAANTENPRSCELASRRSGGCGEGRRGGSGAGGKVWGAEGAEGG